MRSAVEYIASLRKLNTVIYAFGKKMDNFVDDPLIRPHINAAAMTYYLAEQSEFKELMIVNSHLTGKPVNRFTHIHQSTNDLVKKVKMLRELGRRTGACFQRCVGLDAINALYSTTYDMDRKLGTTYHQRLVDYIHHLQESDNMVAGSMTDAKGDRSLRPGRQPDPDQHVHVVKENQDGLILRGCKLHQTGMVNSHEMLLMPTIALVSGEEKYAIACALPVDSPGVNHIFGRQTNDTRKYDCIDQGNVCFGIVGGESMTVLEDVFVPWERVFMSGEVEFSGDLVEKFAAYHRQNYGGCKGGVSDIIIGATFAAVEQIGVSKASHVRDKLIEMLHLNETIYACAVACSAEGSATESGSYFVDPLLANVCKQNVTRFIYEISRLSHDLAGGILATMPSEQDLQHPEVGPLVEKYLTGVKGVIVKDRYRILRLLENMTGGTALVESMHGAGSPQTQRVMIYRQGELEAKKKMALQLAGIIEPGQSRCFLPPSARNGCSERCQQ